MELKESLKVLPKQPGVYFMKNSLGTIIYVGKAKNLKNRVSQYFQKRKDNSPKINEMIEHIFSFEYITTDTELEAFLTECRMIKEIKPKYNRLLKNHKGYFYIKLTVNEEYPKLLKITQRKMDKAIYFGPFTSEGGVDNTILFIKDYYPIRKCTGALAKNSSGCLNFHLGTCMGPCRNVDIREEHKDQINNIIRFLEGSDSEPLKYLHAKMRSASDNLEFEKAAQFRDQIRGIRHVMNKLKIIKISKYGRNIIAVEKFMEAQAKLFFIKGNKLLHLELIKLQEWDYKALEEKLRSLAQDYFKAIKKDTAAGLSQEEIDEAQIIHSYIKNKSNGIISFNIPLSRIDNMNYEKIAELILQK